MAETLKAARARLPVNHNNSHLETQVLLAHVLERDRAWLIAHAHDLLTASQRARFQGLVERRIAGEPVAYLTGHREFRSLELRVTRDVLIPRPETELLVEAALDHVRETGQATISVADLGTGSGAIALALAEELRDVWILATDISLAALKITRDNAERHRLDNLHCMVCDWCTALAADKFQIICSNPPYIAASDPHLDSGDLRFEPRVALCAGSDGLRDLTRIIHQAVRCLVPNGCLFVEHGTDQGEAVRQLFAEHGYQGIRSLRDLAGHERVTLACHPGTAAL